MITSLCRAELCMLLNSNSVRVVSACVHIYTKFSDWMLNLVYTKMLNILHVWPPRFEDAFGP